jgi:N-methylhydantoinase A
MAYYLGVDIGGTFTDCVAVGDRGGTWFAKTPSTHATTPAEGVLRGIDLLAEQIGVEPAALLADTERFSHGTTIGTNLVVERNGARVGLLATAGHGDAILMMRGNGRTAGLPVDQVYNVHATDKPEPLVPRRRIVEVSERVDASGQVLAPMSDESAREAVRELLAGGDIEAVAVALLWSFRSDRHERRLRELIHEVAPELFVSLSCEVSPRQGEYERTVGTVVNSYVGPASSRYLGELERTLAERGLRRAPFIMQAGGGVVPVSAAARMPMETIGSGPAGGLAGAAAIAAAAGHRNVIATDMGGTSFEVGLIVDGRPVLARQRVLEQYTFHHSHLDLRSIACGGGSIARVDPHSGGLRVGPESAGATPGPACYGVGELPTVTDADVVLGLIDPGAFLGGRMKLDKAAAERAVGMVAAELGLSVEETAAGIIRVNSHAAATLIRQRTVERGLDPRRCSLYAFGGAGPVHAFAFMQALGVHEVVVPWGNAASLLSAYGIATSDVVRSFEREVAILAPFEPAALSAAVAKVEATALAAMRESGFTDAELELERVVLMRYAEQYLQELELYLPAAELDAAACVDLEERFAREYVRLYGEGARAVFQAVEVFTVRVNARVRLRRSEHARPAVEVAAGDPAGRRDVYWPGEGAWVPTAVVPGAGLREGAEVEGPAVIELPHTTVSVAPAQRARRHASGNIIVECGS